MRLLHVLQITFALYNYSNFNRVSHFRQRNENNCLNCGTIVHGMYCHNCGQENTEPKQTFWHLVTHFVYDVTHFDGKFFSTAKYLLTKPGFLSLEYIRGKRASYLNPIRMYVFVSAFFFLWFFSVVKPHSTEGVRFSTGKASKQKVKVFKTDEQAAADTAVLDSLRRSLITIGDRDYKSEHDYDSIQRKLPDEERDGWIKRRIAKRVLHLNEQYKNSSEDFIQRLMEHFVHSFPQILFISLPLIALLLKLLYVRRRKTFFYVDHVIFLIHVYCAMFILMFLMMAVSQLGDIGWLWWMKWLLLPLAMYGVWYLYKSMRNFYAQRRIKTILKMLLLLGASFWVMVFLFMVFFVLSLFAV